MSKEQKEPQISVRQIIGGQNSIFADKLIEFFFFYGEFAGIVVYLPEHAINRNQWIIKILVLTYHPIVASYPATNEYFFHELYVEIHILIDE